MQSAFQIELLLNVIDVLIWNVARLKSQDLYRLGRRIRKGDGIRGHFAQDVYIHGCRVNGKMDRHEFCEGVLVVDAGVWFHRGVCCKASLFRVAHFDDAILESFDVETKPGLPLRVLHHRNELLDPIFGDGIALDVVGAIGMQSKRLELDLRFAFVDEVDDEIASVIEREHKEQPLGEVGLQGGVQGLRVEGEPAQDRSWDDTGIGHWCWFDLI